MNSLFLKLPALLLFYLFNCSSVASIDIAAPSKTPPSPTLLPAKSIYKQLSPNRNMLEHNKIDDKLSTMTIDEKIGQLFWVDVYSNTGRTSIDKTKKLIKDYHIGGIIWFRNTKKTSSPYQQLRYTNELQAASAHPLIVAIDGEWGLNMRLDSTVQYPRQLALGAVPNNELIYKFGVEVGQQMKKMGIHFNFAPVVDVNNNPNNPVINDRSFGEDKFNVANKAVAYMNGMHAAGILNSAKHFPGHGDTDTDSHYDLPVIPHDISRLHNIELYPFKRLIQAGVGGIMIAHLNIPSLDARPNRPTTLSKPVVTDLLQQQLNYDGLIITDAMNMQGVAKYFPNGQAEVEALKAGNDILLYSKDVATAVKAIKVALSNGELTEERLDKSVRKILYAKDWLGIAEKAQQIPTKNITSYLNRPAAKQLNKSLREQSVTLVKNSNYRIPYTDLSTYRIATVGIDKGKQIPFQEALSPYAPMQHFSISAKATDAELSQLLQKLTNYNQVIVGLVPQSRYAARQFGISNAVKTFLHQLESQDKLLLSVFGNPYSIKEFTRYKQLIVAYDDHELSQKATAETIFGTLPFRGRLPVGVGTLPFGTGNLTKGNLRLQYGSPEDVGLSNADFYRIDSIAESAIRYRAVPGSVVMVVKDNHVVYHKAYGYHTYKKIHKTQKDDIFDLASITKIAGTMPAIMEAYERGVINPQQSLGELLPELKSTSKGSMIVGEVLNHTAGLKSWIPFYKHTLDNGRLGKMYKRTPTAGYKEVARGIYIDQNYEKDSMLYKITNASNNNRGRYVYSDLGFYYFKHFFERRYQQPYDQFIHSTFYSHVGFPSLTYNPLQKFSPTRIVPSEKDDYYRHQELKGYVHDMGAAMQGGVGGHAGLFGSANDLAIYMQLLLNKGKYGDVQYFEPSTVEYFTRQYNKNSRKGLGFDKPETNSSRSGPTCQSASPQSFGHTGFTGTFCFADPVNNLIVIYLSNRTYPQANNRRLITQNVRPKIQEEAYRIFNQQNRNPLHLIN